MPASEILELLEQTFDADSISDTALTNLNFSCEVRDLSTAEIDELFSSYMEHPGYFAAIQIRTDDGISLLEKRGSTIVIAESGFETLKELDLEVNLDHYRGGYDNFRDSDLARAVDFIHQLSEELAEEGVILEISGNIDKEVVVGELIGNQYSERITDRVNPVLWWSAESFVNWVGNNSVTAAIETLYKYDEVLLLLFIQDPPQVCDVIVSWDATNIASLDGFSLDQAYDLYTERMDQSRRSIRWQNSLPPIHPDHLIELREFFAGPEFDRLLTHAYLSAFSRGVETTTRGFQYVISNDPDFRSEVGDNELGESWSDTELQAIDDFYGDFRKHEEKTAFRELWQLAITEQCLERGVDIVSLPELVGNIREINEELQVTAIEENFEELSDVLEDTQMLMADLISRLSDAAAETSRDIQRLTFTLIGAIVANIFLVLRWSDRSLVPPFSIFVVIILLAFYLPLIQGRINDLDETITQVENDYEFYEQRIRRFNKQLFQLSGLTERKSAYIEMAESQRDRAQEQLELVFGTLLLVLLGLSLWSAIAFQFGGVQSISLLACVLLLGAISLTDSDRNLSHRDLEYFRKNWIIVTIGLIIALLGLQWLIGATPTYFQYLPESLPRYNTTQSTS